MLFCFLYSGLSQNFTNCFIRTIEIFKIGISIVDKVFAKISYGWFEVIAGPFGKFQKDYLRELYLADFLFKKFSFIANQFVLWFCGNAVVKMFGLAKFFLGLLQTWKNYL